MSVTRREFLVTVALVPAVALPRGPQSPGGSKALTAGGALGASSRSRAPVVSFHLDQPYLDLTGLEKPYVPPAGMQSGAALAALTEEQLLSRFYGFI